jgi:hypothetical protein
MNKNSEKIEKTFGQKLCSKIYSKKWKNKKKNLGLRGSPARTPQSGCFDLSE